MKALGLALALVATPAFAEDYAANSEAREWGLYGEEKARFAATVVDPLCEFTGDCPGDCGAGQRQLVLKRTDDDVMIFPMKNSQTSFNGAVEDLLPYCNEAVEVDGLIINNPEINAQNVYLLQLIKREGDAEFSKANTWTKAWAAKHPEAEGKGPWFRRDPRVLAEIADEGWLGLGADSEVEKTFLEDWLQ